MRDHFKCVMANNNAFQHKDHFKSQDSVLSNLDSFEES